MVDIGKNIKIIRELRNITREYISSELKMSVSNYSKIERGEVDLTLSRINQISELLNVDIIVIFTFNINYILSTYYNCILKDHDLHNQNIQFQTDYKEKYIKILEDQNKQLKEN